MALYFEARADGIPTKLRADGALRWRAYRKRVEVLGENGSD